MNIKQIRNATMIITYGGKKFLTDPMLGKKGAYPAFSKTHNQDLKNPTVELPVSMEEIIDVDAVIVTHIHLDHFDKAAIENLPKDIKLFIQNEEEAKIIRNYGFKNVEVLKSEGTKFEDITLYKTVAIHGEDESVFNWYDEVNYSGEACGVVFKHKNEKTVYMAGDTVWCREVQRTIEIYSPEVIIINAGNAQLINGKELIMSKYEIRKVHEQSPQSTIVATHMEAVNHAMLSRKWLREYSRAFKFDSNLLIPEDGESCSL